MEECKICGAPIVWGQTELLKPEKIALNPPVEKYIRVELPPWKKELLVKKVEVFELHSATCGNKKGEK